MDPQGSDPQGSDPLGSAVRAHAIITGGVQGVCYRMETCREARRVGVRGWVKNLSNGSVELMAEGKRQAVEKLVSWCHRGPEFARVQRVDVDWLDPTGQYGPFGIVH